MYAYLRTDPATLTDLCQVRPGERDGLLAPQQHWLDGDDHWTYE